MTYRLASIVVTFVGAICAASISPFAAEIEQDASVPTAQALSESEMVTQGAVLYKRRCARCHSLNGGTDTKLGPDLMGVYGRKAGITESYVHSDVYHEAGEMGLVWNAETLDRYLTGPKEFLGEFTGDPSAKSRMVFKLRRESEREKIIEYLKTVR